LVDGKELGYQYPIQDIQVERAINRIATARITILMEFGSGEDLTFQRSEEGYFNPGKSIEIKLGYHTKEDSVFKGVIVNLGVNANQNYNQLIIESTEKAVKMTQGRKSRYFKNKSDEAVMAAILKENGIPAALDATEYEHQQLIQYHATDWDFIRMRAEANGLLVYTEDGKVQVKKPSVDQAPTLEVAYGKDIIRLKGNVEARYQMPTIEAYSWSMGDQKMVSNHAQEPTENPQGNLTGKALNKALGIQTFAYYNSASLERANLKALADSHLLHRRLARISGEVEIFGTAIPKLNTMLSIKGFGNKMDGHALITRVQHQVAEGLWSTTIGFGLSPKLLANQLAVHEPPAQGLLPAVCGLQIGKVLKINEDPQNECRIQVDIPAIPGGVGIWARLANFYATNKKGTFFIPEVDDEVVVGFLNDDPRFPIILGSLYSSKISTPYPLEKGNPIKAIVTKNDLKIELNDKDKIITVRTPNGNKATFSDKAKSVVFEDEWGNIISMEKSGITIKSQKAIKLEADTKIKLPS
ncbi:MAG: type VI secretion system tip protein VgrG, partial [Bacteroidota bacterium]